MTMKKSSLLTQRREDGDTCPFCGDQASFGNLEYEDAGTYQTVTCFQCGAQWNEWSNITDVFNAVDKDGKEIEIEDDTHPPVAATVLGLNNEDFYDVHDGLEQLIFHVTEMRNYHADLARSWRLWWEDEVGLSAQTNNAEKIKDYYQNWKGFGKKALDDQKYIVRLKWLIETLKGLKREVEAHE